MGVESGRRGAIIRPAVAALKFEILHHLDVARGRRSLDMRSGHPVPYVLNVKLADLPFQELGIHRPFVDPANRQSVGVKRRHRLRKGRSHQNRILISERSPGRCKHARTERDKRTGGLSRATGGIDGHDRHRYGVQRARRILDVGLDGFKILHIGNRMELLDGPGHLDPLGFCTLSPDRKHGALRTNRLEPGGHPKGAIRRRDRATLTVHAIIASYLMAIAIHEFEAQETRIFIAVAIGVIRARGFQACPKGLISGKRRAVTQNIGILAGRLNQGPDLVEIRRNLDLLLLPHLVQKKLGRNQRGNPGQGHENQDLDQRKTPIITELCTHRPSLNDSNGFTRGISNFWFLYLFDQVL